MEAQLKYTPDGKEIKPLYIAVEHCGDRVIATDACEEGIVDEVASMVRSGQWANGIIVFKAIALMSLPSGPVDISLIG